MARIEYALAILKQATTEELAAHESDLSASAQKAASHARGRTKDVLAASEPRRAPAIGRPENERHLLEVAEADFLKLRQVTLPRFGLVNPDGSPLSGDVPLASWDDIVKWELTPEKLRGSDKLLDEKVFTMVPERMGGDQDTWVAMIHAIDSHPVLEGQTQTVMNESAFGSIDGAASSQSPIANWRAYLGEGSVEMERVHEGDNLGYKLKDRLVARKTLKKEGKLKGTNRILWTAALIRALGEGKTIDKHFWTILDDDSANTGSQVPIAGWDVSRPGFRANHPDYPYSFNRLRLWLGGDVSLTLEL